MTLKVFVYGTLKPGERNYLIYCENQVIHTCQAYTYGKLYHLKLGYPGMTIGHEKVKGYLLTFAEEKILIHLDRLEDYQPQRSPHHNQYLRQKLPIYAMTGDSLGNAWGYLMTVENVKKYQGQWIESGWWTQTPNE